MPRVPQPMSVSEKIKPSVYLSFDKDHMPAEFEGLSIGEKILVMLRGEVRMLREDERGGAVEVEYTQLELVGDAKPKTMADALEAVGRKA